MTQANLPAGLQKLMPLKGEAGLKKVATNTTLFVQGVPEKFPCHMAARYVLHAAQDGKYGEICILKGPGGIHKHYFKTLDLVKRIGKWTGPSLTGLKMRPDCWFDERKKIFVLGAKPNPEAKILSA